jgi:hypothetical protein
MERVLGEVIAISFGQLWAAVMFAYALGWFLSGLILWLLERREWSE